MEIVKGFDCLACGESVSQDYTYCDECTEYLRSLWDLPASTFTNQEVSP